VRNDDADAPRWLASAALPDAASPSPARIGERQEQRKHAALARNAAQLDFAAQDIGSSRLIASPSPSSVLAAGTGIRLLKGLEA